MSSKEFVVVFSLTVVHFCRYVLCQIAYAGDCAALQEGAGNQEKILDLANRQALYTNKFYLATLKHPEYNQGWFTWASRTDSSGACLTFVDYENSHGNYRIRGKWYNDTLWAFKKSENEGSYYMFNCRYHNKYLTTSTNSAKQDKEKYFVLDDVDTRPEEMYLWQINEASGGAANEYIIQAACDDSGYHCGFVAQSKDRYNVKSYFMKAIDENLLKGEQYRFTISLWENYFG